MARRLLLSLPAAAVAIVLWVVLNAGGPRSVTAVQVLGGPTRGSQLSLLLRALTVAPAGRTPLPDQALRVSVRGGAELVTWTGSTDQTGHAEARLELKGPLASDPWVRVTGSEGQVLAEGHLALDAGRWLADARRNGGWLKGQAQGELALRVTLGAAALAVPFVGELLVETRAPALPLGGVPHAAVPLTAAPAAEARPLPDAELVLTLDGAELVSPGPPQRSDRQGLARWSIRPLEHAISVRVRARADAREGQWYGALPVVPGALHASVERARLSVRSPIVRSHAYVSLVSERERLGGVILPLFADAMGGAAGAIELAPDLLGRLRSEPTWIVVSSESDKRSPGVVGWPFAAAARGSPSSADQLPRRTLDVADQLLLDGTVEALAREQRRRAEQRQLAAGLLAALAVALAVSFWHEVRGPRRIGPAAAHSGPGLPGPHELGLMQSRGAVLALALLCIVLGVAALAFFGTLAR
jgi:hypothetical protein